MPGTLTPFSPSTTPSSQFTLNQKVIRTIWRHALISTLPLGPTPGLRKAGGSTKLSAQELRESATFSHFAATIQNPKRAQHNVSSHEQPSFLGETFRRKTPNEALRGRIEAAQNGGRNSPPVAKLSGAPLLAGNPRTGSHQHSRGSQQGCNPYPGERVPPRPYLAGRSATSTPTQHTARAPHQRSLLESAS